MEALPEYPEEGDLVVGTVKNVRNFGAFIELEEYPDMLDAQVDSACWDSLGNLLYSRRGILYRVSLNDFEQGRPGAVHDLESLQQDKT